MARARRGFRTLEIALLAILLSVPWTVPLEAGGKELRRLLESLELSGPGVSRWLSALGVNGNDTRQEQLIAVTSRGVIVGRIVGSDFGVTVAPELMARLDEPGADVVLVHNHPTSSSLSWADISFLTKPGVTAVVAVGHDGSVYAAMRGRRFACERVSRLVYHRAAEAARKTLDLEMQISSSLSEGTNLLQYLTHVMADTLRGQRVIEYRAVMAPDRQAHYGVHRDLLEGSLAARVAAILSRPIS
jgi:hypothetical protein